MNKAPASQHNNDLITRDWTQGSIFKNLVALSWPIAISNILMTLGPTIDMIWVGKLGSTAIAGVGIGGTIVQLTMSAMIGLATGMRAMISRAIGERNIEKANNIARQGSVVAAAYAILLAIIGVFFSEELIAITGVEPEVVKEGARYLSINFIGFAPLAFRIMMDNIMQASGDAMNPMRIAIIYRIIHVFLSPYLIFGAGFATTVFPSIGFDFSAWWPLPAYDVAGTAWTSVVSQTLGVIMGLNILFGDRTRIKLSYNRFRLDVSIIWRMIKIGFPALIANMQRTLNQFVLLIFMAPFGTVAVAAHTIVQRIDMFIIMFAGALGTGAGVLVGQNLGAKQPVRAEKSAWAAVGIVEFVTITLSIVMLIFANEFVGLFNSEPELMKTGGEFLRISLVSFSVYGFVMVLMLTTQSAGDTIPVMIISIVAAWGITIPLAYFLPEWTNWGVYGVRWALVAGWVIIAIANTVYFRLGRWKTIPV